MHILLTGASGFIGSHFLQELLKAGHRVSAPVRPQSASKINFPPNENFRILDGNFFEVGLYEQLPRVDVIIHLASIRGAGNAGDDAYKKVNVDGTHALLDYAIRKGIKRFIYCSSVGVLGTIPQQVPAGPNDSPRPDGMYHQTKFESEQMVKAAASAGLQTLILRPTITYGPGDDGFVPRLIAMTTQKQMLLPGIPVKIHLLAVQAFAGLIVRIINQPHWPKKVYHVADKNPVGLQELVDTIYLSRVGKHYPRFLRFPASGYRFAASVLGRIGMDGLKTSIQLISESWTYDIADIENDLGYTAEETLVNIKELLKND